MTISNEEGGLKFIGTSFYSDESVKVWSYIYYTIIEEIDPCNFKLPDGEVEFVYWIKIEELKKEIKVGESKITKDSIDAFYYLLDKI